MTTSQKRMGRPQLIDRDSVIEAAAKLAQPNMRMTTVAEELGVSPGSLYRYFRDREDLLDALAARACAAVELPPPGPWRQWLLEFGVRMRALMIEHPYLLDHRSWNTAVRASRLRLVEAALDVLTTAGFDDATALSIYSLVFGTAYDGAYGVVFREDEADAVDSIKALRETGATALLDRLATAARQFDPETLFLQHLGWVLAGLPEP